MNVVLTPGKLYQIYNNDHIKSDIIGYLDLDWNRKFVTNQNYLPSLISVPSGSYVIFLKQTECDKFHYSCILYGGKIAYVFNIDIEFFLIRNGRKVIKAKW